MRTYTKKELAYKFGVSERTILEDAKHLKLTPQIGDRNSNLYSQRDFSLIEQLRKHCADKSNARESFVPNTEIEIVDDELQVTKYSGSSEIIVKSDFAFDRDQAYAESISFGLTQDPLYDLELLQRISDRRFLLPASRLAPIIGISAKYLSSLKNYEYCGFFLNKEDTNGRSHLWKVTANNE